MKRSLNLFLIHAALLLTDVGCYLGTAFQNVFVYHCRPLFRELPQFNGQPDLVMVVRTHWGSLRRVPLQLQNRWYARKLRGVLSTHGALFPIADEALRAGYNVESFIVKGEIYHVNHEQPKGEWIGRSVSITVPSLI